MYKIWQGSNPKEVLAGLGFFLGAMALVIHVFAFNVLGYPKTTKAKYNPPAVASALR
jgi:Antenna complex alpha/beta subunit